MELYEYGPNDASYRLVQPIDRHSLPRMEMEMEVLKKEAGEDFHLTAFVVENWNDDLSPWEVPAVFGKQGFGGKAKDTLAAILSEIQTDHTHCYLGGYSLAGLFSLWAGCQTDVFSGIAAASPSLWFPQFLDYLKNNHMRANRVYLSLGDREEKTRNPVMATVGDCVRAASEHFQREGLHTTLEWNPGNHFRDSEWRTAKAFAWLINARK